MSKKGYRFTWRHEVYIDAESPEKAKEIFETFDIGKLDECIERGDIQSHGFVESVSAEDEEGNDI